MSAVVEPPAPPVATPPPAVTPSVADVVNMTSAQLKARLDEERGKASTGRESELLKLLGVDKLDDLTKLVKSAKDREAADLTERQKLEKDLSELKTKAARGEKDGALTKTLVDQLFAKLPENAQKVIDAQANGDPHARWALMQIAEALGTAAAPPAPAPPNPPANVAPPPAPPPSGQQTKFQEWEQKRGFSPMAGDIFYQNNVREIEASRPAAR